MSYRSRILDAIGANSFNSVKTDEENNYVFSDKIIKMESLESIMEIDYQFTNSEICNFNAILCNDSGTKFSGIVYFIPKKNSGNAFQAENSIFIIKLINDLMIEKNLEHIILPIGYFDTNHEYFNDERTRRPTIKYPKNSMVALYEYHDKNLSSYLAENNESMKLIDWKVILFQLFFTLASIKEKYPSFEHNNFLLKNILVYKIENSGKYSNYNIGNFVFKLPQVGILCKIGALDSFCINESITKNNYENYDRHFDMSHFIYSLDANIMIGNIKKIPPEINDFLNRIKEHPMLDSHIKNVIINDPLFIDFHQKIFDTHVKSKSDISFVFY